LPLPALLAEPLHAPRLTSRRRSRHVTYSFPLPAPPRSPPLGHRSQIKTLNRPSAGSHRGRQAQGPRHRGCTPFVGGVDPIHGQTPASAGQPSGGPWCSFAALSRSRSLRSGPADTSAGPELQEASRMELDAVAAKEERCDAPGCAVKASPNAKASPKAVMPQRWAAERCASTQS